MELKGRLKLIAHKVPQCDVACDVGTDHAYIPIYLIKNHICRRAIAVDVKRGPLLAASENIRYYNMESLVQTRLGDGLEPLSRYEADAIIIAGMGGILIKDILQKDIEKAKTSKALVLQPMNAIEILREWLYKTGFEIYDEELIDEGEKIYNVINARWTGRVVYHEDIDYYIGPMLVQKRDPLVKKYLEKKLAQAEGILADLKNSNEENHETVIKYTYLKSKYCEIMSILYR